MKGVRNDTDHTICESCLGLGSSETDEDSDGPRMEYDTGVFPQTKTPISGPPGRDLRASSVFGKGPLFQVKEQVQWTLMDSRV